MASTTVINLRADERKRAMIDRAAQAVGKTRSEFILETACREATAVLLDRRLFDLDDKTYRRFTAALDAPPSDNIPRVRPGACDDRLVPLRIAFWRSRH